MTQKDLGDICFVIFGASGDLAVRMLIPSLETISCYKQFSENTKIIGIGRTAFQPNELETKLIDGIRNFSRIGPESDGMCEIPTHFMRRIKYIQGNYDDPKTYASLKAEISKTKFEGVVIYCATPPTLVSLIAEGIYKSGLVQTPQMWIRIVCEKPFGRDVQSAIALNYQLHKCFAEDQIYRIDHYLAKETVTNIFTFRWANTIWEPLWNRNYISHVEIKVAENVDVGTRIGYYEDASVVRDMIQNHLLQILCITAMEPPSVFHPKEIRDEKMKVLHAIRPLQKDDIVLAQYCGYREHKGVPADSTTPTLAIIRFYIDNWRWQGVPFYISSGKCLKQKESVIKVVFKHVPHQLFNQKTCTRSNVLKIRIQPNESIALKQHVKVPGEGLHTVPIPLNFHYADFFGENALQGAYERVLLDAIRGDQSFFTRADEIEQSWRIVEPILNHMDEVRNGSKQIIIYEKGAEIGKGSHLRDPSITPAHPVHKNIFQSVPELNAGTALLIKNKINLSIQEKGICRLALSGGNTPRPYLELLAQDPYKSDIDVSKVHIFFVDERCVSPDDDQSNYKMVKEAWLDKVNFPPENVHRMKGEIDPQQAAKEYEEELKKEFGGEDKIVFDLILLGMGPDGHTASLFPGTDAVNDTKSLVISHFVPQVNMDRITLGRKVLNNADDVMFVLSDKSKMDVYDLVKHAPYFPSILPSQVIKPVHGFLTWNVLL